MDDNAPAGVRAAAGDAVMATHHGTTVQGDDYEIEVTRGAVFRCYDTPGMDRVEVCVEDGVITHSQFLPDEMNQWQARAFAAMLTDAADELESGGCE